MEMVIMSYDEIMDYINLGYKPLYDLFMLLELKCINNRSNKKYKVWLFKNGIIDVHGGNVVEKYIPKHINFGKTVYAHCIYYPFDEDYIYEE